MQPLIMFALSIFMPRFKSINFYQSIPKIKLFLQKNAKFFCAGGSGPRSPSLQRRLGVRPQTLKTSPHCEFLATRLVFYCCYVVWCKPILRLAGVHGFPKAALSLNKFAHPWLRHMLPRLPYRV